MASTHKSRSSVIAAMLCALSLLMASCGSSKSAVSTPGAATNTVYKGEPKTDFQNIIASYNPEWQLVKMPVTATITQPTSLSASGYITMERGKSLSISMRVLGMEVAQLVVVEDSVVVLDRWHKNYMSESIARFLNGFNVQIDNIQDLLLGRAFIVGKDRLTDADVSRFEFERDGELWACMPDAGTDTFSYAFVFVQNMLMSLNVEVANHGTELNYSVPETTPYGPIATGVSVNTQAGNKNIEVSLSYKPAKAQWNSDVTPPSISIPKGYTRIYASDLLKGIKK